MEDPLGNEEEEEEEEACSTVGLFFMNEGGRKKRTKRRGEGQRRETHFLLRTRGRKFMNGSRLSRARASVNSMFGQRSRSLRRAACSCLPHTHTHTQ